MLHALPVFPGRSDLGQLNEIFTVLGTPDEATWPGVTDLEDWGKVHFIPKAGSGLERLFCDASPHAVNLVKQLLICDPSQRLSGYAALDDDYFIVDPLPAVQDEFPQWITHSDSAIGYAIADDDLDVFLDASFEWPVSRSSSDKGDIECPGHPPRSVANDIALTEDEQP